MPYKFVAYSFHTKKLCSRLSLSEVLFYTENGRFVFLSPIGGLEATYGDHLRLMGKRVVDFLLVLIELFSLDVAAEALRVNMGSKSAILLQRGSVNPKFQVEGVAPPTILLIRKLG